jgi:hypothetical protein
MRLFALFLLLATPASAAEAESVTMTLQQFLDLYEKGKPAPDPEPLPPRDFTLSSARYEGEVITQDGEPVSAVFDARIRVEVLKPDGWVRIPIAPSEVALRSAKIGGREATIVPDGAWLTLVTDRKGAFELDLDFAVRVSTHEGRSSLGFTLPPSGATTARLAVPSTDLLDFSVTNARLQDVREERDQRIVEAVLPGTGSLGVTWQRALPEDVEEGVPARMHAELSTLAMLGDGLLEERVSARWTILQGTVERFRLAVPKGVAVVDVEGTGVRDWRVADDILSIDLNFAAEGSWAADLHLERLVEEGGEELTIALPEPLDVARAKGWVGVAARGTVELTAGATGDAAAMDVRLLPSDILAATDAPILLGWKYLGSTATLPVTMTRHEEVAVLVTLLDEAHATTMFTDDGRRLTSIRFRVRNNRKQFLRLALPDKAELWSSSVAGKAITPAKAADGRILVPLVRSSAGALADFEVSVVYVESGEAPVNGKGSFRASLPTADVPITYLAWTVWAPDRARINKKSRTGSLRAVNYMSQPFSGQDLNAVQAPASNAQIQRGAAGQVAHRGLGEGASPVAVRVPLEGQPIHFEKLLALGEELWVGFDYKGLK